MESSIADNSGDAPGTTLNQPSRQNWMIEFEDHKLKQRQVISDLQETLEKADEENIHLLRENAKLLAHNKSLQQISAQSKVLVEELESVKQHLSSTRSFLRTVEGQKKELEMKKSQLEAQVEELATKVFQYSEDQKALQEEVLQEKTMVSELETAIISTTCIFRTPPGFLHHAVVSESPVPSSILSLQIKVMERLQRCMVQIKENEDLLKRKDGCIEEMCTTITEHSSITEVLHNTVRNLQDNLERAQQEIVLHKMEEQEAERIAASPGSGCLMYEIVQAELVPLMFTGILALLVFTGVLALSNNTAQLHQPSHLIPPQPPTCATHPSQRLICWILFLAPQERKLLQAHLDSERRLNRLFGLRLLLFILWRLLVLFHKAVALMVFLALWVSVTVFYACVMHPTILPQSIDSESTLSTLQQEEVGQQKRT